MVPERHALDRAGGPLPPGRGTARQPARLPRTSPAGAQERGLAGGGAAARRWLCELPPGDGNFSSGGKLRRNSYLGRGVGRGCWLAAISWREKDPAGRSFPPARLDSRRSAWKCAPGHGVNPGPGARKDSRAFCHPRPARSTRLPAGAPWAALATAESRGQRKNYPLPSRPCRPFSAQ